MTASTISTRMHSESVHFLSVKHLTETVEVVLLSSPEFLIDRCMTHRGHDCFGDTWGELREMKCLLCQQLLGDSSKLTIAIVGWGRVYQEKQISIRRAYWSDKLLSCGARRQSVAISASHCLYSSLTVAFTRFTTRRLIDKKTHCLLSFLFTSVSNSFFPFTFSLRLFNHTVYVVGCAVLGSHICSTSWGIPLLNMMSTRQVYLPLFSVKRAQLGKQNNCLTQLISALLAAWPIQVKKQKKQQVVRKKCLILSLFVRMF